MVPSPLYVDGRQVERHRVGHREQLLGQVRGHDLARGHHLGGGGEQAPE